MAVLHRFTQALLYSYSLTVPGCGGVLNVTDTVQTVTSPGYPGDYLNNLNCVWSMSTLAGNRIWMNITDIDLESHSSCNYDVLSIFNGKVFLSLFNCSFILLFYV